MSAEALYNAVKSGSVSLDSLNEDGKTALRGYMAGKEQPSIDSIHADQHQQEQSVGFSPQPFSNEPVQPQQPQSFAEKAQNPNTGRDIPIIGPVLKLLDSFSKTPTQHVIADVGQALYTPGAGLANVASFTGAAEQGISKLFGAAESTGAKIAQRAGAEAVTGAPLGVGQYQAQGGDNLGEAAKQGAFGALLGGAGGAAGSALSKSFDSLFSRFKPSEAAPIEQAQPVLGLPEPKSAILAREAQNRSVLPPNTDVIHGQGDIATLGLPESQQYNEIQRIRSGQTLGLPEAQPQTISDFNRRNGNVLPTNNEPIYGQGNIAEPLGLPQGNFVPPTRLKVSDANQSLDYVMNKIKPEVMDIIQAPARRDLLVQYVQKNMQIPLDEVHNMPMTQLQDLGQQIQEQLHGNMKQIAYDVAAKHGHDLPALLEGQAPSLRGQMAKDAQSRVYGVPAEKVNIAKPQFNKEVTGQAAAPKQGLSFKREPKLSDAKANTETPQQMQQRYERQIKEANDRQRISELSKPLIGRVAMPETKIKLSDVKGSLSDTKKVTDTPKLSDLRKSADQVAATVERPKLSDLKAPTKSVQNTLPKDELKFAQTVKGAENTPPELKQALEDTTLYGNKTSDKINHAEATKMIEKHGIEGTKNILLGLKRKPTPSEIVAGNIISQHYARLGGEANLQHSIDLVFKQGVEGRQIGQVIQAFSTWKKLDESGALMIATKNLNKDLKDTKDWRSLTTQEAQPIKESAARIQQVESTKSLADQVKSIIDRKNPNEPLTAAEKETFKQFQDQVKSLNEGVKPFLPKEKAVSKADEIIKKVSEVAPKERTRDQVVSFLDAKAEKARQRLAASRQMGFAAVNKGNPIIDYSIIGASHIAKGVVKLSDFTEQMVKDFGQAVKPQINEIFNRANNIFRKENGLPSVQELDRAVNGAIKNGTFTEEQAHQFKAWANEIGHMSDTFKVEATQDLQKAMNEIGTSTLGQKLSTIQTSAQLLSLPTAIRNVVGNEAFNIIEKINKITAVPIDWTLSKMTGERSIAFMAGNQEKYWSNFVKGAGGGWKGVSPNGQFASLDIHPEAFKSDLNPFKYLQKATGAMLQSFDHAAYMRAYGRTLGEYSKITGKPISELDQAIHDIADHAGQYATFQDDTLLSKLATGAKRLLNKPTDMLSEAAVNKGILPEGASLKGFGMGDLILKYAKTPANIVMRGIDYSPIGLMRGMGELLPLITKKEFNQRAATLALSRGITGTLGLTGLGVALISAGVLTGPASGDADIRSLDQQTGKGEYKVNWSALQRYVMSGFDKNAAKWKPNEDKIFDWGWLQPMAISIAMGVNAQQSVAKQKADGTHSFVAVAKDALVGSMKTILQQPLLQGVQNLVSGVTNVAKYGSWSGIANIFKGAPASFVPALSNQARNFTDNTSRNTYDPNGWKEAVNMVINRIPGLDKQLPPAFGTLGDKKEQIQGGQPNTLSQAAKTFLSPVKMTNYTVSPEAKMVIDLINSSGDTKAAPRSPNKYLMVDKKKVELTPGQYSEIQQMTGEATQKALKQIAPMLANPNVTDAIKVKEVVGVLDKVGQQVRNNLNKEYPQFRPHLKAR